MRCILPGHTGRPLAEVFNKRAFLNGVQTHPQASLQRVCNNYVH